ncbi:hypothetical protein HFP57_17535 [Parasphingopyxis algicola]|uniref:glycosyltransferase family 29 protein n=1 Tax=Parasphingopyxis algicola TaxID=2026624 RepID=UPI0015A45E2A|nr:glycosyltransferase family 29 protein [Parasphingopyxis algicola]QLC26659.1 hypothetical protein HFP57_17535 [Parasphingopyxis algicola]
MQIDSLKDVLKLAQLSNDHRLWVAVAKKLLLYTNPFDHEARVETDELLAQSMVAMRYDLELPLARRASICAVAAHIPNWQLVNSVNGGKTPNWPFLSVLASMPTAHAVLAKILVRTGRADDEGLFEHLAESYSRTADRASIYDLALRIFETGGHLDANRDPGSSDRQRPDTRQSLRAHILSAAKIVREKQAGPGNFALMYELLVEAESLPRRLKKMARSSLARAFAKSRMPDSASGADQELALAVAQQIGTGALVRVLEKREQTNALADFADWLIVNPLSHGLLRSIVKRTPLLTIAYDNSTEEAVERGQGATSPHYLLGKIHYGSSEPETAAAYAETQQALLEQMCGDGNPMTSAALPAIDQWLERYRRKKAFAETAPDADEPEHNGLARWRHIVKLTIALDAGHETDLRLLSSEAAELSENGALRIALHSLASLENASQSLKLSLAKALRSQGFDILTAALVSGYVESSQTAALLFGRALDSHKRPEERISIWRSLTERYRSPAFLVSYAAALIDGLRYDEADAVIADLVDKSPDQSTLLRNRVLMLSRQGKLVAAREEAERLSERFPDCQVVAGDLVRTGFETGKPAPRSYEGTAVERDNVNLFRALSDHDLAVGNVNSAVEIRAAVAERTQHVNDYHRQLNAVFATGEFQEAAELCERMKQRFPGVPAFWKKAGQVCERRRDYDGMLYNFTEMLALDPEEESARSAVGRALIYLDRTQDALDWLGDCANARDESLWTDTLRAFLHARNGDADDAKRALDSVYRKCAQVMDAYREGVARDPRTTYLLNGGYADHPSDIAEHVHRNFDIWTDTLRHGSNALIGNSPSLLEQGRGPAIDAFDTVIRLNDFVIEGYEKDLGTKTDYWYSSANRQASPHRASVERAKTLMMQPHARHFPDIAAFSRGRLGFELDPAETGYLAPCVKMMSENLSYPFPSTGFRVIQILEFLVQCPFTAFGFDFFSSGEMHYFDVGETHLQVGEVHAIDFERDLVNQLIVPYGRHAKFV